MSDNPNFVPMYSTNNIYRDGDDTICLEDELDIIEADIATLETNKADNDHTHTGYVSQADLDLLADIVDTKANVSHTHSNYVSLVNGKVPISQIPSEVKEVRFANTIAERNAMTDLFVGLTVIVVDATGDSTVSSGSAWYVYTGYGWAKTAESESMDVVLNWADIQNKPETFAPSEHSHDNYASVEDIEVLDNALSGKADSNHTHTDYATNESVSQIQATLVEALEGKASANHTHSGFATTDDVESLESVINGKADSNHTHTNYALASDLSLLEDVVDGKADSTHTHDYAPTNHSHSNYATTESLNSLETVVEGKASENHTHSDYASVSHSHTEYAETSHSHSDYSLTSHTHSNYALATDLTSLEDVVDGKANANHSHNYAEIDHDHSSEYADINHHHSGTYAAVAHNHDEDYAEIDHVHTEYSAVGHDHDEDYAPLSHSHTDYATVTSLNELSATVSGKANASHNHNTEYYTQSQIDTKLSAKSDSTHNHNSVYDAIGSASDALTESKAYTDSKIDALVGTGASTTLDTIGEISSAIEDNQDAIDLLNSAIANKANSSDLTSHTNNSTIHVTNDNKNNWNTAYTHSQTAHAPSSAEPNQNAFSNVKVGSTTIAADSKTDTLTFVAGSNITLTPDATGDSITIASTNTVYTHPTTAGNKHIPAGGSSGQVLKWSADGTAVWGNDNNTTYSNATQTASGLMSDADKVKLDGIAVGANNYTLPSAGTNLGGVKSGGDVTISAGVITVNDDSHNHVISNIDGLQSALDGKASSSHTHSDVYTESEVDTLLSGKANSSHTHTIANITNLQSTLDGKANSSHGTHVSYSTTAPVMDGTASVGTASTVARSDHKHPTDTSRAAQTSLDSHTGNKSNPHGVTLSQLGLTATAAELNVLDGITATVTELNYVDGVTSAIQTQLNSKAASGHTHNYAGSSSAGGAATSANKLNTNAGSVTQPVYFANGIPVKTTYTLGASVPSGAKFTDTTYGAVTTSANGLMIASDKSKLDGMVLATVTEVETYLGI